MKKVDLDYYLDLVERELNDSEYDRLAEEDGIKALWDYWQERVIDMVYDLVRDTGASLSKVEIGEEPYTWYIYLPEGISVEDSVFNFVDNFYICVRDDVPAEGEEAVWEFIADVLD